MELQLTFTVSYKLLRPDRCERLEMRVKRQSTSKDWHAHRAGRITGTIFHCVVKTTETTTKTTLMKIMRYSEKELTVPSVVWGNNMNDIARQGYIKEMPKMHQDHQVRHCGLVL